MLNVEGDYEEIVEWLDAHPTYQPEFHSIHGHTQDGYFNYGLYSINQNHPDEACYGCLGGYTGVAMITRFSEMTIELDGAEGFVVLGVENPKHSHLIRF